MRNPQSAQLRPQRAGPKTSAPDPWPQAPGAAGEGWGIGVQGSGIRGGQGSGRAHAEPEVTRRLRRMLQIRLALGVAVFALSPLLFRAYASTLCLFTGALLLLTALYAVLLRRRFHPRLFANVQIFADVFLVTVLIVLTGWEDSKFTFLYIIPIITTSLFFQLRQSISIALLSSMLYAVVILFHRYRLSLPGRENGIETFYSLYIRTVIFCMVGYLCGHLANLLQKEKQELRELKDLHHLILSSMNSGVLTTDASHRIIYANRAAEEILRLPAPQLCKWGLGDLFLSENGRPLEAVLKESLNGHGAMGRRKAEISARTTDGRIVPIGFNISALPNRHGKPVGKVMVFSDLTEVKELERRLRAIDKFRAAGELAAGIAHEIRNPLASITGSVEMLSESQELSGTNRELLSVLMSESTRLNGIIEDFLAYARRGNLDLKKEDLCQIMREAIQLVGRSGKLPPGVRIELVTPPEPAIVSADRACMSQVFLNLLNNAAEAVDGRLPAFAHNDKTKAPGSCPLPDGVALRGRGGMIFVKIESPMVENDRYAITVSDTGCGIPPEKLSRVFEPFFTTKKNGVGIGLCIAERIVREHNGHIDIASEAGKGTSVTVVIPVDQGSSGAEVSGRGGTASLEGQSRVPRRRRSEDATVRLSCSGRDAPKP